MAQTINVDSKPALFMPTLYYSQGDVGRTFEIVVSSSDGFTIPSGATCQMVATKPSGLGFTVAGTVSGNKVTFTTTAVMTDEWGRFPAELRITSGNTVIGTANFYMEGERNPHPDGTTDGQQEQLIPELTLLVERAENAAQTATDDAIEAASATIDEVLNYLPTEVTNLKSELTDETNARILLAGRMTTAEGDIDTLETHKVAQPLDEYNQPTDGTAGQSLRTKGDGTTEWADVGLPTDAQTAQAVSDWLDEHPEATTTVQDKSITLSKFSDEVITNPSKHFAVNGEDAITRLGNVAQSYIKSRNDFIYGGKYTAIREDVHQVDGKWQINCSTFGMLVAFGVSYENSAYQLGTGNNILNDNCCSDLELWNWFKTKWYDSDEDEAYKYTYDLAKWLYDHGYCFEPNDDLSNIKSGDMLLMKGQTGDGGTSTFRDIDHCAIFAYWNNDNMYTVWEVGSLPSAQQYFKSNLEENCVLVARFPMTNVDEPIENIGLFEGQISSANNLISYLYSKGFTPNKYYTFIGKITNNADIGDVYPVIYQENTRLGGYNDAISKPDDDIYVIPFVPPVDSSINLRMNRRSSEIAQPTTTLEWFNIVEGLHFGHERLPYGRRVRVTLNSGYREIINYLTDTFLFYTINGTFATGTNNIGTVSGLAHHGVMTPAFSLCYPSSGVASNVEAYLYSDTLMVRNNSGASITGDLYIALPIYNK